MRSVLGLLMLLIAVITVLGIVWLWPAADEIPPRLGLTTDTLTGTVLAIPEYAETNAALNQEFTMTVRLRGFADDITVIAHPEDAPETGIRVGDRIRVMAAPDFQGETEYFFIDFNRSPQLTLLVVAFIAVVIAVARLKGFAALVGLFGGITIVWFLTIPALLAGRNPVLVALFTASAVMFLVVYLAHGVSWKSTAALLSTLVSLSFVTALGWLVMPAAHINPLLASDYRRLATDIPGMDLKGVLLCGMVLAGVGVLNDVTITQAALVWELRNASPAISRRELFRTAMRIGRDHIASSVYTIAFSYVGTSLVLLLIINTMYQTPLAFLSFGEVAQELVVTGVTSIGLVLAIPFSTFIATALVGGHDSLSVTEGEASLPPLSSTAAVAPETQV